MQEISSIINGQSGEMKYKKYYNKKLKDGNRYQDFIMEFFYLKGLPILQYSSKDYQYRKGESLSRVEIKYDMRIQDTGNLYIEFSEKSNPRNDNYVKSGILRNDNSWFWIQGNYKYIFLFSKKKLIKIYKSRKRYKNRFRQVKIKTSKGILIKLEDAKELSIIYFINQGVKGF